MADIKSTLDLVMERTKHLSLSAEEKDQQKSVEIDKKINGLLQKFTDGKLELGELFSALDDFKASEETGFQTTLLHVIMDRLDIDQDNRDLLTVLESYCHMEIAAIETILSAYHKTRRQEAELRVESAKTELSQKHFISGSAVIPNLRNDLGWIDMLASLKKEYQLHLEQEFTRLKTANKR